FPTVIAAIMMSAVLAAIMSTADSQLLVSASAVSNDLYKRLIHKNASNRELMFVSRGVVVAIALLAGYLAFQGRPGASSGFLEVVMSLVSFAWAGFGCTFGPAILLSLFWKRVNLPGVISGMIVGGIVAFVWKFYLSGFADVHPIFGLYEIVPGFVLNFVVAVVVSLCTKKPSDEIVKEFELVDASRLSDLDLNK
ncbi:MAG: sodium:proline symporter, partial [Fibrobacter sp.]|nr:sodium:proline symporter [Fibrobacter sp.]